MDPRSGCSRTIKVEHTGIQQLLQVHIAVVGLDDLSGGLDGANNGFNTRQFLFAHLCCFIKQHDITEFYLLDNECSEVFFLRHIVRQRVASIELIADTEGIHDGTDTVEHRQSVLCETGYHLGIRTERLRDRCRFTDSGGLDNDVVEGLLRTEVMQLLDEVHLQRAADTSVLQRHQRVVVLTHYSALLDERSIDIHFSDIVHDHGKTNAFGVR